MFSSPPSLASARLEASRIIRYYGFRSPEEVELEDIAYAQGISVEIANLNKVEAFLLRKNSKGIICVSSCPMEVGRRRFAIAHELGHWFCHKNLSQVWLCSTDSIHAYKGSNTELEANAFAAELLMPKSMLTPRINSNSLTIRLVCEIAAEFGTTLTATSVRLVEESKSACCVVFSDGNCVRWFRRSGSASEIRIPRITQEGSRAWDCETEPKYARGPRKVSADAWLTGRDLREYSEVWEESVFLKEYQTVITLLEFC